MKVLLCIRRNYLKSYAGDSEQILQTAKYMNAIGVQATINHGVEDDFSKYDIIHLFNLTAVLETEEYFERALRANRPIVITPIYWNLCKYYAHMGSKDRIIIWERDNNRRKRILHACRAIFPSGTAEKECLQTAFGWDLPCEIIYNGVDEIFIASGNEHKIKVPQLLCVARICPRKNQLVLARVCSRLGLRLALAGNVNNKLYFNQCMEYSNVEYLGFLQKDQLIDAYTQASLHILPSFVETPGLSSLEAAACGCNIVTTCEGGTKEYFEDLAQYCSPYDECDIENAIQRALINDLQPKLMECMQQNFRWEHCLQKLYNVYLKMI